MSYYFILLVFVLLMIPGFLGIFIPLLPGVPLMFVVASIYAILDRFAHLQGRELGLLGIIALTAFVIDHASGIVGAKFGGASKYSTYAGIIGFIVGMILFPPFGSLIGLFLAVYVAELLQHSDRKKALRAAKSSAAGSIIGIAVNAGLGLVFMLLFMWFGLR